MGRTERLETWCRAVILTDFVVCGFSTVGLLILMCLPQYFRDFMFRVIDEMDYDIQTKEEMKPFYEHVLIPLMLASIAAVIIFHFAMTMVLSFGVSKPNLGKLRGWIIVQVLLSILMTIAILILGIRFIQHFFIFIPAVLFQAYRFVSLSIVYKFEQALIAEDERYARRQNKLYQQAIKEATNGNGAVTYGVGGGSTGSVIYNNNYTRLSPMAVRKAQLQLQYQQMKRVPPKERSLNSSINPTNHYFRSTSPVSNSSRPITPISRPTTPEPARTSTPIIYSTITPLAQPPVVVGPGSSFRRKETGV